MARADSSTIQRLWGEFRSKGFSEAQVAGVLGCWQSESGINPVKIESDYVYDFDPTTLTTKAAINSYTVNKCFPSYKNKSINKNAYKGSDGYYYAGMGLAQWTGPRGQALFEYSQANNVSWWTYEAQISYLFSGASSEQYRIDNFFAATENSDSAEYCADRWCVLFEGYTGAAGISERQKTAKELFNVYAGTATSSIPSGLAILAVAENEVGTTEYGVNKVKYTDWYMGTTNYGSDIQWCLIFIVWCFNQAGVSLPCNKTALCQYFWDNTGNHIDANNLEAGDIIMFHWSGNERLCNHVGIVKSKLADGSGYVTIEGNTTSGSGGDQRNGEGVYQRTRKITMGSAGYVVGGIRLSGTTTGAYYYNPASTGGSGTGGYIIGGLLSDGLKLPERETLSLNYRLQRETVTEEVTVHSIKTADGDANSLRVKSTNLLTTPTRVESPFIILRVGNYTFGSYSMEGSFEQRNSSVKISFPNYMTSINITKVNGTVNKYVMKMTYQIENGNDPNLIDKIFSTVGYGTVYISYGDWMAPAFIYREEEAIITKVTSDVDFANSRIIYTIYCTSNALALLGGYYTFAPETAKPSEVIKRMIYNQESKYHLQEMFPGFKNRRNFDQFVSQTDTTVELVAKVGMDALSYINYLVTCMSPTTSDPASAIRDGNYYLTICDDTTGEYGGTYFTVREVETTSGAIALNNTDIYEVDIGYPGDTLVSAFRINTDNSWNLLYDYSQNIAANDYIYNIDSEGNLYSSYSPNITTSSRYLQTTETQRNWWTQMTQFPINATLEIKGLLRPAMLMSYIRVNAMFYGLRHVSSGLYIITKQVDTIDSRGYRTTLSLQRIAGDLDTITTETKTITKEIVKKVYLGDRTQRAEDWASKVSSSIPTVNIQQTPS